MTRIPPQNTAHTAGKRPPKPSTRRYLWRIAATMALYLASLFLAEYVIEDLLITGPIAAICAALPGLAFAGVFWIFAALIVEEKDEFYRLLYVRQGLIATGITLTAAAICGFLERYAILPHVEAFGWPTIWCFGLGIGAIFNKIKYDTFGEAH